MQLVSEHVRLAEPGVAAELDQPRAVRALEIFDDTARRMILFREFDCGVGERTAALAGAGKMLRHLDEPGAKLRARVTGMRPREPVPASVGELGKLAQIFRHQFVLRREMAVEGDLVGAGARSEEHTSELQSRPHLVCRLLLEKKNNTQHPRTPEPQDSDRTNAQ